MSLSALSATPWPATASTTDPPPIHLSERPNILLIVAEDMGPHLSSMGPQPIQTPHLDALAQRGVLFTRAYCTAATCSPARSSLLTGLYPHQNGQLGLAHLGYRMHRGVPTLPAALRRHGYRNGRMGKLHVHPEPVFELPRNVGAEIDLRDPRAVAAAAGAFMREPGEEPFFLMVNLSDAHRKKKKLTHQVAGHPADPVKPEAVETFPAWGGLDSPEIREDVAKYYSTVRRVDDTIGLLQQALDAAGRTDETLVVFTSDHGPSTTRGKLTTYELGVHVPLIVAGPGVQPGQTRHELVSHIDLAPTLHDLSGVPADPRLSGQWTSAPLTPILRGEPTPEAWRDAVFTQYDSHGQSVWAPQRTVREDRYKLTRRLFPGGYFAGMTVDGNPAGHAVRKNEVALTDAARAVFDRFMRSPEFELYDLQNDPHELIDLAGDPALAEVRARLEARLERWMQRTQDYAADPVSLDRLNRHHLAAEGRRIDMKPFVRRWPVTAGGWGRPSQ